MLKFFLILINAIIAFASCKSNGCKEIPETFPSYDAAIQFVRMKEFSFVDEIKISDSSTAWVQHMFSWISVGNYYSCDNKKGFLILSTKRGNMYIGKEVPIEVWKGFTKAPSKGIFYNENLKGKYPIKIREKNLNE